MLRALARAVAVLVTVPLSAHAQTTESPTDSLTVATVEVVAERDSPQVCVTFSERLDRAAGGDFRAFVALSPERPVNVVARDRTLCVEGIEHGQSYTLVLRKGLPGIDGRRLATTDERGVEVPNRKPGLAFRSAGFILPRGAAAGLTLRSVNVDRARLQVLRIGDRGLVEKVYFGRVAQQLSEHELSDLVDRSAEEVWKGDMAISGARNQPALTAFPLDAVIGRLEAGVYIAVADSDALTGEAWARRATQWFVVSELGLNTILGDDGLLVYARSLTSAEPLGGVEMRLLSRDTTELGRVTTGPDGIARFDAQLLRGTGERAPQAIFAYGASGDPGFLDLAAPAFELVDRSTVAPTDTGLDAYVYTDRSLYRPGDTITVGALLRDTAVRPVSSRAMALALARPDGFEVERRSLADAGGGGYATRIELPAGAMTGTWTLAAHADAGGPVIGRTTVRVEEFGPQRLDMTVSAAPPVLDPAVGSDLSIAGRFLDGAPASELPGEISLTLRPAADPYPQHPGYRFGLSQEAAPPRRIALPGFITAEDGTARVQARLEPASDGTRPMEAVVEATLVDFGGQPVQRHLVLPVRDKPFAIGIKPRFSGNAVAEGATAGFDVIVVAPDGAPLDHPGLSYELFEEESEYAWFEANGRWDYKVVVKDRRIGGGTLAPMAARPALIEEAVSSGRYRLEVFDPATGVASGMRFAAGWWLSAAADERPDAVDVIVMLPAYRGGETAVVYVRPPYPSQVLIAVADRTVRSAVTRAIGPEGAFLEIPVDPSWAGGVHVLATAFPTPDARPAAPLRRAVGSGWLGVAPGERRLGVRIEAPAGAQGGETVTALVRVDGTRPDQPSFVALTAVDEAALAPGPHRAPDPIAHYFAPRDLAVELRDVYGRLIEPAAPPAGAQETMPRAPGGARGALPGSGRPATLASGVLPVGADGTVAVPLSLPRGAARYRLSATAWNADRLGGGTAAMTVTETFRVRPALPRHLAVGDRAKAVVQIENATDAPVTVDATLSAAGPLTLDGTGTTGTLAPGAAATVSGTMTATGAGDGWVTVTLTGPAGRTDTRSWPITVERAGMPVVGRLSEPLAPEAAATVGPDLLADPGPDIVAMLAVGDLPDVDLPGLLLATDAAGPAGGALNAASQAVALLAAPDAAASLLPGGAAAVTAKAQAALDRLLTFQRADGAFAPWSPRGDADLWLTAFALDVMARARAAGLRVPEPPQRAGLEALKRTIDNTWVDAEELPARAYALYVLVGAKMIEAAPVRFFRESFWDKLPTDFARAQIAAALAALGDARAAGEAFERLSGARIVPGPLRDHGSALRDEAGLVALMAGSNPDRGRIAAAGEHLARTLAASPRISVHERAWLLLAVRALLDRDPPVKVAINGETIEPGPLLARRVDAAGLPLTLKNLGTEPVRLLVTASGATAAPAGAENGFTIDRRLYDMDGKPVDPASVRVNSRLVVVLTGSATDGQAHQALITDRWPAGFVVDAVRHADSPPLGGLAWIGAPTPTDHIETAADRLAAAVTLGPETPSFRVVYMLRAAYPGEFTAPPAAVEDMDRPHLYARGASARVAVTEP